FSTLVIATIVSEFIRGGRVLQGKLNTNIFGGMYHLTRRNMRRYGGYIVHFGVTWPALALPDRHSIRKKNRRWRRAISCRLAATLWSGRSTRKTITRTTVRMRRCWTFIKTGNTSQG